MIQAIHKFGSLFDAWFGTLNGIVQITVLLAIVFAICVLLLMFSIALDKVYPS